MKKPLLLTLLLVACAPSVHYPPDTPLSYPVSYRTLFDRTLQELTAAYLPTQRGRQTFSITRADPETGLITAVRNERGPTTQLNYRLSRDDLIGDRDGAVGDLYRGFPFGLGFALTLPLLAPIPEQTILTVVVRPEGSGASLVYSAQGPDGESSSDGVRLLQGVVEKLGARFRAVSPPATTPLEPVSP